MSSMVFANPVLQALFLLVFALWVGTIVWSYADARSRGKPGWAVALLVALLAWPLGLLVWIIARPERGRVPAP